MFEPQRALPVRLEVPPRLTPNRHETLTDYARRVATSLDTNEPFHLGGASFGGMLALEVARNARPRSVVLISSCRSCASVPLAARLAGLLVPVLPPHVFSLMKRWTAPARPAFGISSLEHVRLLSDMLADTPPEFLRWSIEAILRWNGAPDLRAPVFHVHGERDHVLPLRRVRPDRVVAGAGHLANLTHPREVNEAIADFIATVERA